MKALYFSVLFLIIGFSSARATAADGEPAETLQSPTGLEVPSTEKLGVIVDLQKNKPSSLSITAEKIEAKVNQVLRKGGIVPISPKNPEADGHVLIVRVQTIGSAFSINLEMGRYVFYRVANRSLEIFSSTWRRSNIGTSGNDSKYILDTVEEVMELFTNEFLKANGK